MTKASKLYRLVTIFMPLLLSLPVLAQAKLEGIRSADATVDGVKLHYLTAGQGPAVILPHGYTQTSRMWRPLMPQLAGKFAVIAPDLPGIGDSAIFDVIGAVQNLDKPQRAAERWWNQSGAVCPSGVRAFRCDCLTKDSNYA